jgi:hypothetical protein
VIPAPQVVLVVPPGAQDTEISHGLHQFLPYWEDGHPLLVTAIFTGMRSSELRGLTWSAVDFADKTITVRQRADEWGVMGQPKSHAGQRTIPMSPTGLNTLRAWKLACPKGELDHVFPNIAGKVQRLQNLANRFWRPLQRAAGLVDEKGEPLFDLHALRHFAASTWIEAGFTPKRLQALLGHSSIQMTFDRYGHLFPSVEDDHAKFARIEREIGLVAKLSSSCPPGDTPGLRHLCNMAGEFAVEIAEMLGFTAGDARFGKSRVTAADPETPIPTQVARRRLGNADQPMAPKGLPSSLVQHGALAPS